MSQPPAMEPNRKASEEHQTSVYGWRLAFSLAADVQFDDGVLTRIVRRRGLPPIILDAAAAPARLLMLLSSGPQMFGREDLATARSLMALGFVDAHAVRGEAAAASLTFVARAPAVGFTLPPRMRLHPHLLVRPALACLEAQRAGRPARLLLSSTHASALLSRFAGSSDGVEPKDLDADERPLAALFAAAGLFADDEPSQAWDAIDLAFHARTRHASLVEPYGPKGDKYQPGPPRRTAETGSAVALPSPDILRLMDEDLPFARVIEERSSYLATGDGEITLAALGETLFRSLRARETRAGQGPRPYPSGGRAYEIDAYLLIAAVEGVAPGLYRYDAQGHCLAKVASAERSSATGVLAQDAAASVGMTTPPPVLIILAADFDQLHSRYAAVPYALVLKNVGVIMHAIALSAHASGIVARPIGGGRAAAFAAAAAVDPLLVGSVGEIALAPKRRP